MYLANAKSTSDVEDRGCSTTTDTGTAHPEVQRAKVRMMMRRETLKIPKLRLDLLLYTNMGAEALAKYLITTKVLAARRWELGIDNNPANQTNATGWAHSTSPSVDTMTAPAWRQGVRRKRT